MEIRNLILTKATASNKKEIKKNDCVNLGFHIQEQVLRHLRNAVIRLINFSYYK